MVVKAGVTPTEAAQRARREIEKRAIVGVVLNSVAESHLQDSHYYGAYGYGNGYGESKNGRN
jgi:hypothetical protein